MRARLGGKNALEGKTINVGRLTIESNVDGVISRLGKKGWLILISQALKTFFVSFFILFIIYKLVTRHLSEISEFAPALSIEAEDEFLSLDREDNAQPDELDQISQAMNQMKQDPIHEAAERESNRRSNCERCGRPSSKVRHRC